ncbi:MAG: hypothetical protein ABT20_13235 [Rubrivivax sp. SCN 70-15]|nr:MAG: hypothetical protein ABT20_13235 [Rubrivivax sp. SCN 70-15]
MFSHRLLPWLVVWGAFVAADAGAAPAEVPGIDTSLDLQAPSDPTNKVTTPSIDRLGAPEIQSGSKTIQMLLELQPAKPQLVTQAKDAAVDDRRVPPPKLRALLPAGANAPSPSGAEFQNVKPQAPAVAPQIEWARDQSLGISANGGGAGYAREGYAAARTRPGAQDDLDLKAWLPLRLLQLVRENRKMVLAGSLVALALVWAGASVASRPRR